MAQKYGSRGSRIFGPCKPAGAAFLAHLRPNNVAPLLVEGFGLMKSFREIIQNQLLFEGFGIVKSFWARNKKTNS